MGPAGKFYEERIALYERAHYSHGEEQAEVNEILSWYEKKNARILDLGCGSGLHALRLAEKGHGVIGVDNSDPAIALARSRAEGNPRLRFEVSDIEKDSLIGFGVQDLVISLGNTLSHLSRNSMLPLFDRVRRALSPGGMFVFNALYWASPFMRNVVERDPSGEINIIWERALKEEKGAVTLKGHFLEEGVTQAFEVQCYKVPEVMSLLDHAGFSSARWSNRLDFKGRTLAGANTVYFRALNTR